MVSLKTYYGNSVINSEDLPLIRSSGNFNPPGNYPLDESKNWRNIKFPTGEMPPSKNLKYACKPLSNTAFFNQIAFKSTENPLLQLFFSDININYIKTTVKEEILKMRNQTINTDLDTNNLQNMMQEIFSLAYQERTPMYNDPQNSNIKQILSKLNGEVINKYIKYVISGIDMYKYYQNDISTLPLPLERPVHTSIKGSNVVSYQVGLSSTEEFNRDIREWNNKFSRFSN